MLKHQHVVVNADVNLPPLKSAVWYIEGWVQRLIQAIGMKILLGPYATYCDKVGNRGMTVICAIETSSITFHSWDEDGGKIRLDVYTCSDLDIATVMKFVGEFEPTEIEYIFFDRDDEIKVKEHKKINVKAAKD